MSDTKFKIFKYPIAGEKFQQLSMHRNARVLDVQMQIDPTADSVQMVLWALVMPSEPVIERKLAMIDTGEEIPAELLERFEYVRTIQALAPRRTANNEVVPKSIVFHLYLERDIGGAFDPLAN